MAAYLPVSKSTFLSKSSPGQERTFKIPSDTSNGDTITVQITEPALRADNLSLETWASSAILAAQICKLDVNFPDRCLSAVKAFSPSKQQPSDGSTTPTSANIIPILELGAGTGLVGITAAKVWSQDSVLSDLAPIVPGLWANVDINKALFPSTDSAAADDHHDGSATHDSRPLPQLRCGTLDWTKPSHLHLSPHSSAEQGGEEWRTLSAPETKAHVIMAADTCYSAEHPRMLSDVIFRWLHKSPDARVLLGTALRVAYLDEITELWDRLEEGGLECVRQGQEEAGEEDFDDERLVEWSFWRWKEV